MFEKGQGPIIPLIGATLLLMVLLPNFALSGPYRVILSEPRDLSTRPGNGHIELNWRAPSQGAASVRGYNIYRGMKKDSMALVASLSDPELEYTDSSIINTVEYHYMVTAYNPLEEGPPSSIVSEAGDGAAPSISIALPRDGTYLSGGVVDISWSGSDTGSGIESYDVSIGGAVIPLPPATSEYTFEDVPDGNFTISVGATDRAGNRGEASSSTIMDSVPPDLSIISPSDGEFVKGPSVVVQWVRADGLSGIERTLVLLDKSDPLNAGTGTGLILENVTEGDHWLGIVVYDRSGNIREEELTFKVDSIPPDIIIKGSGEVIHTNQSEITLDVHVKDLLDPDPVLMVKAGGGEWEVQEDGSSARILNLVEGLNNILLIAVDGAGNERDMTVKVFRDISAPLIEMIGIYNGMSFNKSHFLVSWTIADPLGSGVGPSFLSIDNGLKMRIDPEGYFSSPILSEGEHVVTITSTDLSGNTARLMRSVIIDTVPPSITGHNPPVGAVYDLKMLRINFSERISPSGSSIHSPSLYGETIWSGDHAVFVTEGNVPMGVPITFIVTVTDIAGNVMPSRNITFFTSDLGGIRGRVVSVNGRPISGAEVLLDNGRIARTEADGSFEMEDSQGDRILYITSRGYEGSVRKAIILAGRENDIGTIQLERDGSGTDALPKGIIYAVAASISILMLVSAVVILVFALRRERWED